MPFAFTAPLSFRITNCTPADRSQGIERDHGQVQNNQIDLELPPVLFRISVVDSMIKFTLTLQMSCFFELNHYIAGGCACLYIFLFGCRYQIEERAWLKLLQKADFGKVKMIYRRYR